MADISLYLNNVYSSKTEEEDDSDTELTSDLSTDDYVRVNLGGGGARKNRGRRRRRDSYEERVPRRIIHFSSGETMEEFSTEDEDEEEEEEGEEGPSPPRNLCSYLWFYFLKRPAAFLLSVILYLGEKVAALFDVTTGKYQYVIDTYYRQKQKEQEQMWKEMEAEADQVARETDVDADTGLAVVQVPEESERRLASQTDREEPPEAHVDRRDIDEAAAAALQSYGDAADTTKTTTALPPADRTDTPSPPRVTYHMEEDAKGTIKDTFRLQGPSELHHIV